MESEYSQLQAVKSISQNHENFMRLSSSYLICWAIKAICFYKLQPIVLQKTASIVATIYIHRDTTHVCRCGVQLSAWYTEKFLSRRMPHMLSCKASRGLLSACWWACCRASFRIFVSSIGLQFSFAVSKYLGETIPGKPFDVPYCIALSLRIDPDCKTWDYIALANERLHK